MEGGALRNRVTPGEAPGAGSSVANVRAAKAVALRKALGMVTGAPRTTAPAGSEAPAHEVGQRLATDELRPPTLGRCSAVKADAAAAADGPDQP